MLRRTFLKSFPLLGGFFVPPLRVTDPPVPDPGSSMSFKADDIITNWEDCAPELNAYLYNFYNVRIEFSARPYFISSPLTPDRGATLMGWGNGATLRANPDFKGAYMVHQHRDGIPVSPDTPGVTDRVYLRDIMFDGQNVPGLSGGLFSLQQRAEWRSVRFENFPGTGVKLVDCTDPIFTSLQCSNCGIGLEIIGSNPMTFNNLNIEGSHGRHIYIHLYPDGTGSNHCLWFTGLHLEGLQGQVNFEVDQPRTFQIVVRDAYIAPGAGAKTVFKFSVHNQTERQHSYTLQNIRINSAECIVLDDPQVIGNPLMASQFGVAEAQINLFISPNDEYALANTPNAVVITDRDTGVRRL